MRTEGDDGSVARASSCRRSREWKGLRGVGPGDWDRVEGGAHGGVHVRGQMTLSLAYL